ncbi:MAG: hypothetical protein P1U41_00030 [Vicingaceae bacterium]|nr:hypothetical protein [Vicingaceae bacterium]
MFVNKILSTTLFITMLVGSVFSQETISSKDEKKMLEKAEFYYEDEENKNIPKALSIFEKLSTNKPNDPYYKLMKGICYTYFKNKRGDALKTLLDVKEKNVEFNEVNFYLGKAYAVNRRFDEAIESYQTYLGFEDVPEDQKALARQNIIYCQNAKEYVKDSVAVEIVSIGHPINTEFSEYVPVITPDESMMIYTYSGDRSKGGLLDPSGKPDSDGSYYEDVMVSYKMRDDWLEPESIGENINTNGHDASIALSVDGQTLFIYKQDKKDHGDIYVSRLNADVWGKPEKLEGEVNTDDSWEGSATLTANGKTLYFASDREGGFGGRDLYSATMQPSGSWGEIMNLGSTINTRFDDDAPFIHPDGKTMYFSSKGHNSMGGYDIFYTYLASEGWDAPENVGYPVNSIDDDRFYVLSADAKTGYYSTSGRSENGMHDIYSVAPGHFGKRPILALVVGVTKADGEPVDADITVSNDKTGEIEGKYKSNSASGKYMLALTPGNKYKIAIEVEGYETKIDYIDIESLATYVQVEHDFNVYSKDNVEGVSVSDDLDPLQGKIDTQIEKYKKESTKEGYEEMVYEKILNERGEEKAAGVEYFVGADCVDSTKVDEEILAKINMVKYPDGSSKSILGPYSTLLASEIAKEKLKSQSEECENVEVSVNDNGIEKTFKQYYASEYTKTDFVEPTIHDKLTGNDTIVDNDTTDIDNAVDLVENKDLDLKGDDLSNASDKSITGLSFKVEIAAVSDTNDFNLQHLEKYGKITAKTYPDGITRYTFGPFATLDDAEKFRQGLIEQEGKHEDSFVTVFVFGQRKVFNDLPEKQKEDLIKTTQEIKDTVETSPDPIITKGPCVTEMKDFSWFVGKDLNDKTVYGKLIDMGGSSCSEGLEFKVQIAAYRFPKNYKWNHLKQYGEPLVLDYPDGITRFTQGTFVTMREAEVLRQKIIKSGQKDAWITPFYNGKRMLLEELIAVNFYGKSVN